MTIPKLSLTL